MSSLLRHIRDWVQTETLPLLLAERPERAVAIGIVLYSLILVQHGYDRSRTADVVAMIREQTPVIHVEYPFVVAQKMTLDEAVIGQLALACCGCVTAFVRDDVINSADTEYLQTLRRQMLQSDEFQTISVTVSDVPNTEAGKRFCWQFLGLRTSVTAAVTTNVFLKTARLMEYCVKDIGAKLRFNVPR